METPEGNAMLVIRRKAGTGTKDLADRPRGVMAKAAGTGESLGRKGILWKAYMYSEERNGNQERLEWSEL